MLDFLCISTRTKKNGNIEIYPKFRVYPPSEDLMIKGGDFYAVWDEKKERWSTNETDVCRLIDNAMEEFRIERKQYLGENASIAYLWDSESGMIDNWHRYVQKQCRDSFEPLDENLIFANTPTKKENYSTKSLPYELKSGSIDNWHKIIGTLYSDEERRKIEWAIGAVVSGDSKWIQKFLVFYGSAGTGKSTILNIIQMLFQGYDAVFDAKALGMSNNSFALEPFKDNPLVAIQHDGDLSHIEDNTRLNSLVSHEKMTVNAKYTKLYSSAFKAFLFMGTNKPVKITDARSGIIRRLIDVQPSGDKLTVKEYDKCMRGVKFELGAIAQHCLDVYLSDPEAYNDYKPLNMMDATNDTYNFIVENYSTFDRNDGTTLKAAWAMYQEFCDEAKVPYPLSKRLFKEELKNYFDDYKDRDGVNYNVFSGFKRDRFESVVSAAEPIDIPEYNGWIELKEQKSVFDKECFDCAAQLASEDGSRPMYKWDNCKTVLKDIQTTELHFVKPEVHHIVIDFDIKDKSGNKSLALNLQEASKWPETYAEVSKSGSGLHLHYIFDGDPLQLSSVYDDKVEIKVFGGNSSLRRKLTLCNDKPVAHISSGLPFKKEKKDYMITTEDVADDKRLRAVIKKALRKEIHSATKPNVDFIKKVLDDAYASGQPYDVSDMYNDIMAFCNSSTNQANQCIKIFKEMHFASDDVKPNIDESTDETPILFYDIEVFPNLLLVCYKFRGDDKVVTLINPKPQHIEWMLKYRLVGFNNRKYDNHIIYNCLLGGTAEDAYELSQHIIVDGKGFYGEAYNLSYTDIYDYMANKMSLKKLEIKMGIHHLELGLPWDNPVPEHLWPKVAEYCKNDVRATEAAFEYTSADFTARLILADLAGMTPNDTTNSLTTRFIFGKEKHPQKDFKYRNLAEPVFEMDEESLQFLKDVFPEMMEERHGDAQSLLPYFEGYEFKDGKSTYLGEDVGEGGFAEGNPGYWINVALLDVASMHPHSTMAEVLFGPEFTKAYHQIVYGRVHIKHKAWDIVDGYLDGKLKPYIEKVKAGEMSHKDLANALKIAINSVYGLTAAHFDNAFHDPRNVDNIVAKRGALFMVKLKHTLMEMGYTIAHIKTDSIKIPNATPEVIKFVYDFGKRYGYTFEHECTYEKMVLLNDAVYIAKYATPDNCNAMYGYVPGDNIEHHEKNEPWTATGTQFAVPFVFKKLFSGEPIEFEDMNETFSVSKGDLYLDKDENLDWESRILMENDRKKLQTKMKKLDIDDPEREVMQKRIDELDILIAEQHDLHFVGRVGSFMPIKPGYDGGVLYRVADGKLAAASGTTGYRWIEAETARENGLEDLVDISFYQKLVDDAREAINKHVDYDYFVDYDVPPIQINSCCGDCNFCGYLRRIKDAVDCALLSDNEDWVNGKCYSTLSKYCTESAMSTIPF